MAQDTQTTALQNLTLNEKDTTVDQTTTVAAPESSGYNTPKMDEKATLQQDASKSSGPQRGPYEAPLPSCTPNQRPALTPDQQKKYNDLLETVKGWETIPTKSARGAPSEPIADNERMFLTRECLLRYLRASNWSPVEAPKRLLATLTWRREYGVENITADEVSVESETGKQHILGYDNHCRTCLYMAPGRQNTKKSERQIKHLVFMLERTVDLMPPGQDSCAILINFKGATNSGSPSVSQGRETMTILQGHYPERLGRACVSELPWFINIFFKMIRPFIDPNTSEKIVFNGNVGDYVPPSQLDREFGGDSDFVYEHDKYWPALNKLCDERRAAYRQRWIEAGKRIGEYETYLRGGEHKPLKDLEDEATSTTAAPADAA